MICLCLPVQLFFFLLAVDHKNRLPAIGQEEPYRHRRGMLRACLVRLRPIPQRQRPQMRRTRSTTLQSSHVDQRTGLPTMVNILEKNSTRRVAVAESSVACPSCLSPMFQARADGQRQPLELHTAKKGPVLSTAIVSGTMGAKLTSQLIPFCHPIPLEQCTFDIAIHRSERKKNRAKGAFHIQIRCTAATTNKTGVEMEAMVGASVCALAIYDMLKGVEGAQKSGGLFIGKTRLLFKAGGKSGDIAHRDVNAKELHQYKSLVCGRHSP